MKNIFYLSIVAVFFFTACTSKNQDSKSLSAEQKSWIDKANRYEKNGWIAVHLEGTSDAIGFQHGYLLADEIIDLRGALIMMNEKTTGKNWEFFRNESERLFWSKIPEEYRKELDGIVSGVNARFEKDTIDRKDLIAMNSIIEMAAYYVPWHDSQTNPTPPGHCSAIAATGSWTKDGKIVMAHSCWTDYVTGQRWNVILDIVPEKGNRILMDVLPGFIHSGDDFYINSAGLIVTETTITQFGGFDTTGIAEFIRARKAIQYSSSIDEWVATMKEKNNGGYANNWLIGDNKTGEIANLELGLKNQILQKTKDGYFVGANFPVNEKLIKEETTFDVKDLSTSPNARKIRWEELVKQNMGKIDVDAAMKFMGDHYDTWRKQDKVSGLSLCGHFDVDEVAATYWGSTSFYPTGAVQAKATDGSLAKDMKLWAIMGHPCGEAFIAKDFLAAHPEFSYQKEFLRDMPGEKWALFTAGEIK
ncbi:MAG: C45 family peptidase [Bacteroidales bacterium]